MPTQYINFPGSLNLPQAADNSITMYNPAMSNGPASTGANIASYGRMGPYMNIQGVLTSNGVGPGSVLSLGIPPGYTIDATFAAPGTSGVCTGSCKLFKAGTGPFPGVSLFLTNTSISFVTSDNTSNSLLGSEMPSSSQLNWNAIVPIVGWNQ